MAQRQPGVIYGIAAYTIWGLLPLYWPLLEPADAVEILAHRMVWSLIVILLLLALAGRWTAFVSITRNRRARWLLVLAAAILSVNWGVYIWGVNNEHVVETALGYFINPIVTVLIGVLVLQEHLRRAQWIAVGLCAVAVAVLTGAYGRLPWIAIFLAGSFAAYGLIKKTANVPAIESLGVETVAVFLPALGYLAYLQMAGTSTFLSESPGHAALLASAGIATVLPLLAFGAAAIRVPLSTLGLLQYIAPSLQFLVGVAVYGEPMPLERLIGFVLVWMALAVLSIDALNAGRRAAAARRPADVETSEAVKA